MIKTEFEAATDGFISPSGALQDVQPAVRMSPSVSTRLIYRDSHHLLPTRQEMRLSVFAVKEPGSRYVNALHTIEHMDGWPRPMYERFTLDRVAVESTGITLPERIYRPALHVHCSLGGLMLVGWGKLHLGSQN